MGKIPNIPFRKPNKDHIEFEIFPLQSLFNRNKTLSHSIDQPHRLEFFILLFITKGNGKHRIDFKEYSFEENSLIFISKGQVHAFDIQPEVDGFLILFTEGFLSKNLIHADILSFSRLYNYHFQLPVIQPEGGMGEVFGQIVKEIYNEYTSHESFGKEQMLRLLLSLLLLRAERIKKTMIPREKNPGWFKKFMGFKSLVEQHAAQTRNAKDYADMMNLSYNHLNQISKSVAGTTAKAFIDKLLVLEIKRRLAVSDISVKELTYETGFDEPTNFVKFFKKHAGLSPSKFKKTIRK